MSTSLWSSKSFCQVTSIPRFRAWRNSDEDFQDRHLQPTLKHGGGSIIVSDCFSRAGVVNLALVNGIMNRQSTFSYYEENTSILPITPNLTKPQCPELSPIENLWVILNNKVDKSNVTNKQNYVAALKKAWDELDPQHDS
ncbi:uncharacterized protein LOC129780140 [Toxorhynchites rutilus septentrionalis]|uniref:uncharacterized protein LOC129780140 n=1 Tax=Toxorhynchites rutilus septentrionalis TaxID=329112 RepID=UPI002478914B|nr:uncharacterized protein LOC129780140 [Toxorhynchites rutilus septentrionalis]